MGSRTCYSPVYQDTNVSHIADLRICSPTQFMPAWECPELSGVEKDDIQKATFMDTEMQRWAHKPRSEWEESMRVPIRVAYLLRKSIHDQSKCLRPEMTVAHENKLHASVVSSCAPVSQLLLLLLLLLVRVLVCSICSMIILE